MPIMQVDVSGASSWALSFDETTDGNVFNTPRSSWFTRSRWSVAFLDPTAVALAEVFVVTLAVALPDAVVFSVFVFRRIVVVVEVVFWAFLPCIISFSRATVLSVFSIDRLPGRL